jgi:hypothetical protein
VKRKIIIVISIYLSLKLLKNKIKFVTLPKSERNVVKVFVFSMFLLLFVL